MILMGGNGQLFSVKLTEEQKRVMELFSEVERLKVNAFAGSGKTTTLIELVKRNKDKKFLFLVFNRAVKEELSKKLPQNAVVYTVHSLAYKYLRGKIKGNLVKRREFTDAIINLLDLKDKDYIYGKFLSDFLEAYCNSEYGKLSEEVIDKILTINYEIRKRALSVFGEDYKNNREKIVYRLLKDLKYIIYAVNQGNIPFTHGLYLKIFHLTWRKWKGDFENFDVIAVDEGQDLNGVQKDLFISLPIFKKIIVGDRHQSIYGWRGALNTLASLKDGWMNIYLTQSFRFENEKIPIVANNFLKHWKAEEKLITSKPNSKKVQKKAILTRTIARLVEVAYELDETFTTPVDLKELERELRKGENILNYINTKDEYFLRGLPYYVSRVIRRVVEEKNKQVEEVIRALKQMGEIDIAFAVDFAYDYDIDEVFEVLYKKYRKSAPLVISTAHRVKGLEFDDVKIEDDFPSPIEVVANHLLEKKELVGKISKEDVEKVFDAIKKDDESIKDILDEINLGYVAITRARKNIGGQGFSKLQNAFNKKPNPIQIVAMVDDFQNIYSLLVKEEPKKNNEDDLDIFDALF